ncbi:MAG: hypothetical protein ABI707_10320 [Ferruginibacter sp.]
MMKLRPELIFVLFVSSCIYDPPEKGQEISIHNQTDKTIIVLDSLKGDFPNLYDTSIVNGRIYIRRQSNYITEYSVYQSFYSDNKINSQKNKTTNKITLYFIDQKDAQNTLGQISSNHLFRSFEINTDTLKKHDLNHLFINRDTMLLEHDYNYFINLKQ